MITKCDVLLRSVTLLVFDRQRTFCFYFHWEMPLNAVGWKTEEDEKLATLVEPYKFLYDIQDPNRNNIVAREIIWQQIATQLSKSVEDCKKRWRGLRDNYVRRKRLGSHPKEGVSEKLQFLDSMNIEDDTAEEVAERPDEEVMIGTEQVILDNQDYYEITVVDRPQDHQTKPVIKILPKPIKPIEPPKKIMKKHGGRKKAVPILPSLTPVKILPKPILMNGPKLVQYTEETKTPEQRSQAIDKLIEKILKENTNEIDVFFRSMAASVKKLHPHLIPKVKMEVCNVIAKYEMQDYDNNKY